MTMEQIIENNKHVYIFMWKTRGKTIPQRIGYHSDYVKRLALANDSEFVLSGGLDRKINLWHYNQPRGKPTVILESDSPSASIYALACTPQGNTIVSGSPEKIVNVWDPRVVGKAPPSSDTTIKLWSLSMPSRPYTTYTHFDDSVWCLASASPNLETFWAGCRDGTVTKTCRLNLDGVGGFGGDETSESVFLVEVSNTPALSLDTSQDPAGGDQADAATEPLWREPDDQIL
eukprot:jgi/Hompol1/3219/HPOL_001537-RA